MKIIAQLDLIPSIRNPIFILKLKLIFIIKLKLT